MANPRVQDLSDPAKPVLREIATDSITGNLTVSGSVSVGNDVSITDDLTVGADITVINGDVSFTAGGVASSDYLTTTGLLSCDDLTATGVVSVAQLALHGDTTMSVGADLTILNGNINHQNGGHTLDTGSVIVTAGDVQVTAGDLTVVAGIASFGGQCIAAQFAIGAGTPSGTGAAIPDAAGGGTVDAEARAAINTLLAQLRAKGFIAP